MIPRRDKNQPKLPSIADLNPRHINNILDSTVLFDIYTKQTSPEFQLFFERNKDNKSHKTVIFAILDRIQNESSNVAVYKKKYQTDDIELPTRRESRKIARKYLRMYGKPKDYYVPNRIKNSAFRTHAQYQANGENLSKTDCILLAIAMAYDDVTIVTSDRGLVRAIKRKCRNKKRTYVIDPKKFRPKAKPKPT